MALLSNLLCLFLTASLVSGHLLSDDQTKRRLWKSEAEEGRRALTRNQDRQHRSVNSLKVLDFSADNDGKLDSNNEYTSATLDAGLLPESFTICSAVMVEAWHGKSARMFTLGTNGVQWGYIRIFAASSYTQYKVKLGSVFFIKQTEAVFFPLQWKRACLSLDTSKVTMVVDGQLLGEEEYRREEDTDRLTNLSLTLAVDIFGYEYPVKIANLHVFSSPSSIERMEKMTMAGEEECGAPGDFLTWENADWTLRGEAKIIEVDMELEGPCKREAQVQLFTADFKEHQGCMHHCQKIVNGRSPPVTTEEEWENFKFEVDLIAEDHSDLPYMWLSAKMEAEEAIWKDFYTGQRLKDNWEKPYWYSTRKFGDHCLGAYTDVPWAKSWDDTWPCSYFLDQSCPCSYPAQPLLKLRGLCSPLINWLFSPKHLNDAPGNLILLGQLTTRIRYDAANSKWVLTDAKSGVKAVSRATELSYVLGKHDWTISDDVYKCSEGKPYTTKLKLTGCKEEGEFTCDDGQCIKMERRCDQVTGEEPNCRDKSDENGCQLIVFENNYNKNIPPIASDRDGTAIPANVSISITLMKVVEIEEVDHSIHLQFRISLQWQENRVKYKNLKDKTSLNALSDGDTPRLWLPLVIFDNTDQKESTRLGMDWEWTTGVSVVKEGNFTRSGIEEVDEAEIFEGAENTLKMIQTYTWEFQCQYMLQRYPFDTQVAKNVQRCL